MAKGFVYIISNKAMPGLFKVGYTLKDPALRAQELDSTGVPHPYLVEFEILVDDPYTLEQNVHSYLKEYNENKEWFRCNFDECVIAIHKCYRGKIYYEKIQKKERELEYRRKQAEEQKIQAEKERLRREQQIKEIQQQKDEEKEEKVYLISELDAYIQRQRRKYSFILILSAFMLGAYMSDGFKYFESFLIVFLCGLLGTTVIMCFTSDTYWERKFLMKRKNNNPRLAKIIESIQRERSQQNKE